ncbi:MAG: 3-beta hydroxysteroid dehydrogenase/isomerase family, partial [Planctomycetota bacterium]
MGTVLITGGAGFLGVGVAERLLARDPAVRIVLTDLAEHPRTARLGGRAAFVRADLSDAA